MKIDFEWNSSVARGFCVRFATVHCTKNKVTKILFTRIQPKHATLKTTPAVKAGLANSVWTLERRGEIWDRIRTTQAIS